MAYNSSKHASTGFTPAELDGGQNIRLPLDNALSTVSSANQLDAVAFLRKWEDNKLAAHRHLLAAQDRQRAAADKRRRDVQYAAGDKVRLQLKDLSPSKLGSQKLEPVTIGPYIAESVSSDVNVTLNLPPSSRMHSTVHVDRLQPHYERDLERFPEVQEPDNPALPVPSATDRSELEHSIEAAIAPVHDEEAEAEGSEPEATETSGRGVRFRKQRDPGFFVSDY